VDFDAYQEKAAETAVYPGQGTFIGLSYAVMGLNGEAGETAEQVKKMWRDDGADIPETVAKVIDKIEADLRSGKISYETLLRTARMSLQYAFNVPVSEERQEKIVKELGDSLWYAARVASELGISLNDVAQQNLDKLAARKKADLIHGEGSAR
jgi:NTP pyrophosphatase (non-canonical NTP hydrolase)